MNAPEYISIIGPTASGKSALALRLAHELDGELINCDSVQLYRGFDIGSAKPSAEERQLVAHHLLDYLEWNEDFDAKQYAKAAAEAIADVRQREKVPILVGGTGLYLRALWQEAWHDLPKDAALRAVLSELSAEELRERLLRLDPARAAALHPNDRFRLQRAVEIATILGHPLGELLPAASERHRALVIKVACPRSILHARIEERTRLMLAQGLVQEVKGLLSEGVDRNCKPMQSIGYAEALQALEEAWPDERLEAAIIISTRQYAKRQDTWFRKVNAELDWDAGTEWDSFRKALRNRLFPLVS